MKRVQRILPGGLFVPEAAYEFHRFLVGNRPQGGEHWLRSRELKNLAQARNTLVGGRMIRSSFAGD
jgi:hypothetical protein